MIREIILPKLGETMEEGYISQWFKAEGEKVEKGEPLFEVMSDKTNFEVESLYSGILRKIIEPPSDRPVQVTSVIGYLADSMDEALPESDTTTIDKESEETPQPSSEPPPPLQPTIQKEKEGDRIKASPLAKKTALELGVDIAMVQPTKGKNRIEKSDVLLYHKENLGKKTPPYIVRKWSPLRRIIADKLTESKQTIPHYYLSTCICMDALSLIRNEKKAKGEKITWTDFILWYCSRLLSDFPLLNATVVQDEIREYTTIDLGLAVSVPDGLIVPVLQNLEKDDLSSISKKVKEMAVAAKENRLSKEDVEHARFIVSNLGMYGIKNFSAIINPPATAILAVGAVEEEPIVKRKQIVIGETMWVTLSLDHRVVDGAYGGIFLQRLKKAMENPAELIFS
jgi:pyruvate dehydrogenase E2 component (dihydrolipoamide acetyltransferase)